MSDTLYVVRNIVLREKTLCRNLYKKMKEHACEF